MNPVQRPLNSRGTISMLMVIQALLLITTPLQHQANSSTHEAPGGARTRRMWLA